MTEKSLIGDVNLVDKAPENLDIGEGTNPSLGGRFRGVSVGRNEYGYFAFTHRTRTNKTYNSPADIPDNDIQFVRSTG
jgi:hypothetical protein